MTTTIRAGLTWTNRHGHTFTVDRPDPMGGWQVIRVREGKRSVKVMVPECIREEMARAAGKPIPKRTGDDPIDPFAREMFVRLFGE